MSEDCLIIGIDAGGTKTELLAFSTRAHVTFTLFGPAANLNRVGLRDTGQILANLIQEAQRQYPGVPIGSIFVGVSGAGRRSDQEQLQALLCRLLGAACPPDVIVSHDALIALDGAFSGGSGIILITGTGSIAYARDTVGAFRRAGGWGSRLGDDGSGYSLGVQGLRAVAFAYDGGPETALQTRLNEQFGIGSLEALLTSVYQEDWSLQSFAPIVVHTAEDGDAVAQTIISQQTGSLAHVVEALAKRCGPIERRIALVGGLINEAYYRAALQQALRKVLPGWETQLPDHRPVVGALRMAQEGADLAELPAQ